MEENRPAGYVIGTQQLLGRKDLTLAEKLVFMRISGFALFFESAENTADFLGLSASTVRRAKTKLERLGLLNVVENTGHGKKYKPNLSVLLTPQNEPGAGQEDEPIKHPKNEEKAQETQNSGVIQAEKTEEPESYGNEDINYCMEAWRDIVGAPIIGKIQANRRACHNLLRKEINPALPKGRPTIESLLKLVRESKKDRFAPRISDYAELQSKLNQLIDWAMRKREQQHSNILDLRSEL